MSNSSPANEQPVALQRADATSRPLVSVVVPIYNVESYVEQCLESLRGQTLSEFNVICVDDGSTDGSAQIVQTFVDQDSRFTLIQQPNAGLSAARNAGVSEASGQYLLFLDSDDYVSANTLESLTSIARRDQLDVLFFDAASFFETQELAEAHGSYQKYYTRSADYSQPRSGAELFTQMLGPDDYRPSACLQLISRQHYVDADLEFVEGLIHEDNLFTFQCLLTAQRAAHTAQALYQRRVRNGSITTQAQPTSEYASALTTYVELNRFLTTHVVHEQAKAAVADYVSRTLSRAIRYAVDLSDPEVTSPASSEAPVDVHVAVLAVMMQRREIRRRKLAESSISAKIRRKLGFS
jgi:hypothetical protein